MKLPMPKDILLSTQSITELTCNICNLSFISPCDFKLHKLGTLEQVSSKAKVEETEPIPLLSHRHKFECDKCLKIFSSEKGLHQHEGKIHNFSKRSFKCPICDKKFRDNSALKFHTRQVHEKSTRVSCNECKQTFYSKYVLEKHSQRCPAQEIEISS
ncbi:unnamed protein product [Blepharisma stoltei]|uniref:C2H2-type domain-containing protein n=1 Tax=Blepharisma stoltei TaxID=1481888 RepID=A0AAU9K068_9CILI|nr:unnamed protein product [Blepharisma stoltei]